FLHFPLHPPPTPLPYTPLFRSDRFLDQLSGGQRQRSYVAMVLAQDTDYILLDEPLNNLDMKHSVLMMQQLRRAADELGKTIVVRSEEHTSELQSRFDLVCRLLL